ncbi:P22 coat protein [Brevibacillus laterosporus]|nr:P22 phage major capsid protein family protein [Brevibacillus laterosporus]TPG71162.1 P22 coat protein [Brevibacillus laterosporus]
MANQFITVKQVAQEALLQLSNTTVMQGLVHTDYANEFKKQGDTVQIRKPSTFVAKEFDKKIELQEINESSIDVKMDKIADVSVPITSKEMTQNIEDFNIQVLSPAVSALSQKIDMDIMSLYADIPYFYGVAGHSPDSLDYFAQAGKVLNNNKVPLSDRRLVFDPEAQARLLTIPSIVNAEKSGSTDALRNASIGKIMGFDNFMSQNVYTHEAGTYALATDVKATGTKGKYSVTLTGKGSGKLVKGDLLVITGKQYVVTANTDEAVSGQITASVYPALANNYSGTDVQLISVHISNVAFHKNAFAFVSRPLEKPIGGADSHVESYKGLSIRVTFDYDIKEKTNILSFDALYGIKTLQPELACRVLG